MHRSERDFQTMRKITKHSATTGGLLVLRRRGPTIAWTRWVAALQTALSLALVALLATGCGKSTDTPSTNSKPKVVCTVAMIADIAHRIGGEHVQVVALMGSGVDPHLFKPTRSDIALLSDADLILANGLVLEGKMGETFDRLAASGKTVVRVGEVVHDAERREMQRETGTHPDPHVWMDPNLWSRASERIRDALVALAPANKDEFTARAAEVAADLARLHEYAATAFDTIPAESRVLITAHDAFSYLGQRYDLHVEGIQGISTESEAGLRDLERLADLIASRRIKAVFVETTVSERTIAALVKAARDKGHDVRIGGSLFSDAMGKPGTYEGTYVGMIDHNVTTIVRALGGVAPERGMNARLSTEPTTEPTPQPAKAPTP